MVMIHTLTILLVQSARIGSLGACCTLGVACAGFAQPPERPASTVREPDDDAPPSDPVASRTTNDAADKATIDEVLALYRRLHVEMEPGARSDLIVELLGDPREEVMALGFELCSRDLSSGAAISPEAQDAAVDLLDADAALVRSSAVRLVTRLGLDDTQRLLADAIVAERDPDVAAAILRGLERWPTIEVVDEVLAWYERPGPARRAAAGAAWALAQRGAFEDPSERERVVTILRTIPDDRLGAYDMRLLAALGETNDLRRLTEIIEHGDDSRRMEAARAMAGTPRGVEHLVAHAQDDPTLFGPASEALIRHRANPDGLRRLAALPCADPQTRRDAILRMGARLDRADLGDAVRLARSESDLDGALSIELLTPLIASDRTPGPREVPGALLLASLEQERGRPDRSLEILSLIDLDALDPAMRVRAGALRAGALVMVGRYDDAAALGGDAAPWLDALERAEDPARRHAIARAITARGLALTPDQRAIVGVHLDDQVGDDQDSESTDAGEQDAAGEPDPTQSDDSNDDEMSEEDSASEDAASEDAASEDSASEDAATEDGASEDGASEDAASEDKTTGDDPG